MAIYFIIDRIVVPAVFNVERSDYVDNMNQWRQRPVGENVRYILLLIYMSTIGHISFVRSIMDPILALHARTGMQAVESLHGSMVAIRTFLLIPLVLLFMIKIIAFMRNKLPSGRRLLYVLAGIGIPLSIILLAIMGGSRPPMRTFYALPLAYAFMFFYCIKSSRKTVAVTVACLALFTAVYQAQITAQLFYSDQMRYNEDVRLAHKLNDQIMQVQPDDGKLPVALVGRYRMASWFYANANFLQGEVIGHSFFEWDLDQIYDPTRRGLIFMRNLGIYFDRPSRDQLVQAHGKAESMPIFPNPGSVKRMEDFILVKLSDWQALYEDKQDR